jgi:hypothetical protein
MSGPISLPDGPKSRWEELNEIVCNIHYTCDMQVVDAKGKPVVHEYITYREWLSRRNKLRTGKTV